MKGPNPPKNSADLFLRIAKLSAAAEWAADESREALRDADIDPDRFTAGLFDRIKGALKDSPAYWRNMAMRRREALMAKLQSATRSHIQRVWRGREAAIERIKAISARLPAGTEYGVAFREYDKCSDEDLASMVEELEIIEQLSQSEPGE